MAPCSSTHSALSLHSSKDRHKMRKPVVEKMRRDRINSCIEQLKVLLEKEFHKQDPNAKLEKADVLEMTVAFLKQQLQPQSPQSHGYSRCWKETLAFLSKDSLKDATLPHLVHRDGRDISSSHGHIQAAEKQLTGPHGAVWRPW
ncbi:transcription factor HES-5-like [Labrus bergylta]|uniref:Transcription factor HES-5 n=1 Tax=Labrus bergylta TaxID=56723 RepID=A0A3Q3FL19_9LABR|nr:transcription factor HES-5-like [Labrus bergylta]XP_020484123.1 transcription factor HES-5-like [Labrus bergylta]